MLSKQFIEEMKQELIKAKKQMQEDLSSLSAHTELGSDIDSNAQEVEEDELNSDIRGKLTADLEKIDKALLKIEQGTYGTDDEGKEIPEKRLKILPWADKAV